LQLLAKYFEKHDKNTWLFPKGSKFFKDGASLHQAEQHVRDLGTSSEKSKKRGKRKRNDEEDDY